MIRITSFLAIAVLCVSCTTVMMGTKFDLDDVNELVPGQSTFQEAKEIMGPPNSLMFGANGTKLYVWSYMSSGFNRFTTRTVAITFDDQGIMTNVQHQPVKNVGTK